MDGVQIYPVIVARCSDRSSGGSRRFEDWIGRAYLRALVVKRSPRSQRAFGGRGVSSKHYLPSKITSYLRRLQAEYAGSGQTVLAEILTAARILVIEETDYDNWNGGTYGHDVKLFLPASVLAKIKVREQKGISDEILGDLRICSEGISNEFFRAVVLELDDVDDSEYQQAAPLSQRPQIDANTLKIWKPGHVRLFISHRDTHKKEAKSLADALEGYGITAFVAHDTIEPMTTWQNEILKGLETMEMMLAFVTDDFHESTWTNQELGFAMGRNIPIVSLKLQRRDPSGFIGNVQALRGRLENAAASAPDLYKLLAEKLGNGDRLQSALISAFVESPDFVETKLRFDRMAGVVDRLTDEQVELIIRGFEANDQLHNAGHLTSKYERLRRFLEQTTDQRYIVAGKKISLIKEAVDEENPF